MNDFRLSFSPQCEMIFTSLICVRHIIVLENGPCIYLYGLPSPLVFHVGQRPRRWPNNKPIFFQRDLFTEYV